jgi:hypothetical protein
LKFLEVFSKKVLTKDTFHNNIGKHRLKELKMKKFAFLVVSCFLMVSLYAQNTSDFEIQGDDDGTMTILNYKGTAKDIVIPEKIFNMPVTRLMDGAFKNKGLTSVVIPGTIAIIGNEVFRENHLVTVTIPDSVTFIGDYAFYGNQLTSVTIPQNVEYIGNHAFQRNRLISIVIPNSVRVINSGAFANNQIATVTIGTGVVIIGTEAFANNSLSSITIPDSVTFVGDSAFSDNERITNIVLGNGLTYIGASAFYNTRVTSIIIPPSVVYIGSAAFETYGSIGTLNTITIGRYVLGSNSFSNNNNFDVFYKNSNYRKAGRYTFSNGRWNYTP